MLSDNDVYTISLTGIDVTETNADVAHDFVATMSGVAQEPVVISFTTTNGTAGVTDFTAQSAVSYTIPAGLTSVNIPVTILGDLISEPSGNLHRCDSNCQCQRTADHHWNRHR